MLRLETLRNMETKVREGMRLGSIGVDSGETFLEELQIAVEVAECVQDKSYLVTLEQLKRQLNKADNYSVIFEGTYVAAAEVANFPYENMYLIWASCPKA